MCNDRTTPLDAGRFRGESRTSRPKIVSNDNKVKKNHVQVRRPRNDNKQHTWRARHTQHKYTNAHLPRSSRRQNHDPKGSSRQPVVTMFCPVTITGHVTYTQLNRNLNIVIIKIINFFFFML